MAANQEPPRVLIAGGGPGGLLASLLLNNIGVASTVVERAKEPDEWSSKSYTLVLGDRGKSSLERGGCLESALTAGNERRWVRFFDAQSGEMKSIPKKSPGIGFTRPSLVECLEKHVVDCPLVTLRRGLGVSGVSTSDTSPGLKVHLDDGTTISATHVIGADGKWSKVRQSIPSLDSQTKMITCPSFGVSMNSPTPPKGFQNDATYVINPSKECMFYVIVSPRPSGEFSISMVCYDETLERYPWLSPPADLEPEDLGKGGWEHEYSALPESLKAEDSLSNHLEQLFKEELPAFYEILDRRTFTSARVNRNVTWLEMSDDDGSYSTKDGTVALIGDAAHAMTPSMGEGCNTALESAVKLVDSVATAMQNKGESSCSCNTMSEGFVQYGLARPKDIIPIQKASASRNILKK